MKFCFDGEKGNEKLLSKMHDGKCRAGLKTENSGLFDHEIRLLGWVGNWHENFRLNKASLGLRIFKF